MTTACHDLWNFAAACYAQPGVEAACLELQQAGADVCLILAAAWLERRGVQPCEAHFEALRNVSQGWQSQAVMPLRTLRQHWKQSAASDPALATLRRQIKQLELDAEKVQLERLQQASRSWPTGGETAHWLEPIYPDLPLPDAAIDRLRQAAAQLFAEG